MNDTSIEVPLHERYLPRQRVTFTVAANEPLVLDRSDRVWFVVSGHVDVFAVRVEDGQSAGRRRFLFSCERGDALFGLGMGRESGIRLFASGLPDTRVTMAQRARLEEAGALSKDGYLIEQLERWVRAFSAVLAVPHRDETTRTISDAAAMTLEPGQTARSPAGLRWVHINGPGARACGIHALDPGTYFPLAPGTFIDTRERVEVTSLDTEAWLLADTGWRALDVLHAIVLAQETARAREDSAREATRSAARAEANQAALGASITALQGVLREDASVAVSQLGPDAHPLLPACAVILEALAVNPNVLSSVRQTPGTSAALLLERICRAARVRTRRVALRDRWWSSPASPILASKGPEGMPVALIPKGRAFYLYEGTGRPPQRVDSAVAASLQPFAHVFYRGFDDRAISVFGLLRFALFGSTRELRNVLILAAVIGVLGIFPAVGTRWIFDDIIPSADKGLLLHLCLALVTFHLAASALGLVRSLATIRVEERMSNQLQAAVWDRLMKLPATFFRGYSVGELSLRAQAIEAIRREIAGGVSATILGAIFSFFNLAVMFAFDAGLALVALSSVLVLAFATAWSTVLRIPIAREETRVQNRIAGFLLEVFTGMRKIRAAGAEARAFSVWSGSFAHACRLRLRGRAIADRASILQTIFPLAATAAILAAMMMGGGRDLSTGEFLAFGAAFGVFAAAIRDLTRVALGALEIFPLYEQAQPILSAAPETKDARLDPGELTGEIELHHVSFRYAPDAPWVLDDINLSVRPGELLAIVGPSGSGKSTLMRLLLGFERPSAGAIKLDGQDLFSLDPVETRRQIGAVLQSSQLLDGSIRQNITGAALYDDARVWEALALASIDQDVRDMPMGLDTWLSQNGATLSGGQRQRLIIARALIRKPRILVFDEATSALDNRAQAAVSDSLDQLDRTRIVIAHRLSTISRAHRIVVLDRGRMVESGTFDELMKIGGLFARLAARQL